MSRLKQFWLLALVMIGAGAGVAYEIDRPFTGGHQSYSANYSVIARNYLRYGYADTKLGWVVNADRVPPEQFIYYTRHPPLFGVILSVGLGALGDNERVMIVATCVLLLGNLFSSWRGSARANAPHSGSAISASFCTRRCPRRKLP